MPPEAQGPDAPDSGAPDSGAPESPPEGNSAGGEAFPSGPAESRDGLKGADPGGYDGPAMQCEATRLMIAVRAGDTKAFDELARAVRGRAFQVARTLVGSRDDAMELTQDAFLKVYRARQSYDPSQPFLPWFHRILRNTCFSFLRKNRRVGRRSLTVRGPDGEESELEVVDPAPGPTAGAEADERRQLFRRAMSQLSERDREILALRHYQEFSYKQIARTLGIPEGTVMSRLFHARRRLREALAPLLGMDLPEPGPEQGTRE